MAKTQIVDIVKGLVAKLDYTVKITNNVIDGDGNYVLSTENTYYLTKNKGVEIDGNKYIVVSFVFNVSVTVAPVGHVIPVTATSFILPSPLFFHGTVVSTEKEVIAHMEQAPDAYPIIYLYENIRETNIADKTKLINREAPIQLFFLDLYDDADDYNEPILEGVIKPLSNLECEFLEEIQKTRSGIGKLTKDWQSMNLARFAITTYQGEEKRIFNAFLSGIQLDITLPIKKC